MADITEGDLRAGLRDKGRITGVIVIARPVDDAVEFTPFLLLSWMRGYHRIARWRGGERRYREFERLFKLLRDLGYAECIPVFDATDPKLLRVRAIARALGLPPEAAPRKDAAPAAGQDTTAGTQDAPPDGPDDMLPDDEDDSEEPIPI